MKNHILNSRTRTNSLLLCAVSLCVCAAFAACSDSDDAPSALPQQETLLTLDGVSDYIELTNAEQTDWQITACPEWITPVKQQGSATDQIEVYVESNGRTPLRQGDITVRYANGRTHTTRTAQNNLNYMRRSYAAGWGFDVRTYSDSRGLRDQIFNIQRIKRDDADLYRNEPMRGSNITFYYGEDSSDLQKNISANLDLSGKFNTFSLGLQANFGMSAINNSKRIFSWIRGVYGEHVAYLNALDTYTAQSKDWFTADFKAMRKEVIDSKGSDETISRLVNNYGTHFVTKAELGGCYDYYYSSVYDSSKSGIDVQATLNFAYAKKFGFKASVDYSKDLSSMNQEVIEKFSVKGGNNVDITNKVYAGTVKQADTNAWVATLEEGTKWELIYFTLTPISELFPEDIEEKIESYMNRLYYSEVSVTRTVNGQHTTDKDK